MIHVWFDSIYTRLGLTRHINQEQSIVPTLPPPMLPYTPRPPPAPYVRKNTGHTIVSRKDDLAITTPNGEILTLSLAQLYNPAHCFVHFYSFLETIGSVAAQIRQEQAESAIYLLTLYNYARIGDVAQYKNLYLSGLECRDDDEYGTNDLDVFDPLCADVYARFAVNLEIVCNSVLVVLSQPPETSAKKSKSITIRSGNKLAQIDA